MEAIEITSSDLPTFKPADHLDDTYKRHVNIDFDGVYDGFLRFFFENDETWFLYIVPYSNFNKYGNNNIAIALKYFMYLNHSDFGDQWYIPMVVGTMIVFDKDMWRKYYKVVDDTKHYPVMDFKNFPTKWNVRLLRGDCPDYVKTNHKIEIEDLADYSDLFVPILTHFGNWLMFCNIPKKIQFHIYWKDIHGNYVLCPYEEEPLVRFKPHTYYIRENLIKWLGI